MRGLARAPVGLLQTGVDFTRRLGFGGTASSGSGGTHTTRGQLDTAAQRRHELDTAAGGFEYTA